MITRNQVAQRIQNINSRIIPQTKFSKSLGIFFLMIIIFTLGVTPYLVSDVFADTIDISSWVANDPDDGDTTYSNGDTLTLTFSANTNATNGGTMTDAEVKANFTFATPNIATGATFSGLWTSLSTLQIIADTAGTAPTIGGTTVQGALPADGRIGTAVDGQNNGLDGTHGLTNTLSSALTGDFGLFVAVTTSNGSGCDGDCQEPTLGVNNDGRRLVDNGFSYNGKAIDVERFFTPYPLVTVDVGVQNVAKFKIYENEGPDNVSHFELAFGLANGQSIGMSKAVINWDKSWDGIETIDIVDPENVLDGVTVSTSEGNCSEDSKQKCLLVTVVHTFRAPLDFNILGTNVWDSKHNAWQNYYNHGIEVTGESLNPAKEYDGINRGHIYHLTETSKTSAVDEFGNFWSLEYGLWSMDYIPNKKPVDELTMHGYTRTNSNFEMYKYGQYLIAKTTLIEICPHCLDESYDKINNIFSYDFTKRVQKLDDPEIQSLLKLESDKAQKIISELLEPIKFNKLVSSQNVNDVKYN